MATSTTTSQTKLFEHAKDLIANHELVHESGFPSKVLKDFSSNILLPTENTNEMRLDIASWAIELAFVPLKKKVTSLFVCKSKNFKIRRNLSWSNCSSAFQRNFND